MNHDEAIADRYLRSLELGDVVYEPDGKIPPDFTVGSDLAVEVRRLNENFVHEGGSEGLENLTIYLWRMLQALSKDYAKTAEEKTYWISFHYERPLENLSEVRREVKRVLDNFIRNPSDSPQSFEIGPNFFLKILYLGPVIELDHQRYAIASSHDRNRGGFVIPNLLRNLELCLERKNLSVAPHRSKYDRWWLVLIDYVALGIATNERDELEKHLPKKDFWEKIIILHPTTEKEIFSF